MNEETLKGRWNQLKGHAKNQWADLTDDELDAIEGDRDRLIGVIQQRYGQTREDAEKQVRSWLNEQERKLADTEKLHHDIEALKKDVEKFRSDLGASVSNTQDLSREKLNATKQRLQAAVRSFEGKTAIVVGNIGTVAQEKSHQAVRATREKIAHKPLTTALISFGMGLMTAFLLDRRKKRT